MELYEVDELGIDIRRFTSFGVIKVGLDVDRTRKNGIKVEFIISTGFPAANTSVASLHTSRSFSACESTVLLPL